MTGATSARRYRAPTTDTAKRGWRYLILAPGAWRVWLSYRRDSPFPWNPRDWEAPSVSGGFWLNVPRGRPLIYAGSLHDNHSATYEPDVARRIAHAQFPEFGVPFAVALAPYGAPLARDQMRRLAPVAFASAGQGRLVPVDWSKRAERRFLGWHRDPRKPKGSSETGVGSGGGGILLFGLGLAWQAVGSGIASSAAALDEGEWAPCLKELTRTLAESAPAQRLGQALRWKLQHLGMGAVADFGGEPDPVEAARRQGYRGLLQTEFHDIRLHDCEESGRFCLAFSVRVRLVDTGSAEPAYETIFTYANPTRRIDETMLQDVTAEILLTPPSPCRELKAYCSDMGQTMARRELDEAISRLADRILESPR